MITFGTLSKIVSGVIGFWSFVLLLGMVFLFALGFRRIRQNGLAEVITLLCGTALTYIMLQSILGANDNLVSHPFAIKIIRKFSEIPAWVVVLICLLLTISEVFFFVKNVKWERTHITDVSLKEAVDSLPAGVCAYEDSGRVVLKNAVMEKISNAIAKEVLLNGLLFEQSVEAYDSTDMVGRKKVLLLPNGFVYIFSKEKITFEGSNLTLLTAFDMTEEYEKIQILLQKKKSVQELNAQLVEYNRDIVSIITEQEILNAKVKIHDELGAGLLAIRHYLINGGGNKEKEEIINKLNTVEYVTDEVPWHEDEMYKEGSIFRRIFEKANRPLSTPEEIEAAIAKKEAELKMPKKAMAEEPMVLTDFTDKEIGAVLGADVTDGKSELEHALTAYSKFLKDPVNMCEILTEQSHSPYGNAQPGMVYGFALRDFNEDKIPELVIDFGQPALPLMQKIYIYSYSESDGRVRQMFKMPEGANGGYGLKYLKENMNESYIQQYNEELEATIAQNSDYAESLLNVKYQGPHMVGTYGRYLVAFDEGVEEDTYKTLKWYDFVEDNMQSYTEMLADMDDYLDYTTDESCEDDPEEVLNNFRPILFYDINDENIEKIISADYWNKNVGNDAFSDYSAEDAYDFLTKKSMWYYDLEIMDDDESYDSISCYDYDEETGESTTIYFDLDKRIQSHFRVNR